jgi:hypothetical protein
MAFARRTRAPEVIRRQVERLPARTLVAAASQIKLDGQSVQSLKISAQEWQQEAWRLYDISGELRYVAGRRGAQLSRVRYYAAEVDEMGAAGDESKDKKIQGLAETMFGGPAAKAEALRLIGIQLFVAGECYVVAESVSEAASDKWYVVSPTDIKKEAGGLKVKKPDGSWHELRNNTDLAFRVWTPHPKQYEQADSPTRSVLPILREIERLTMLTFSQIDSRLISAGILLLRQGIDFPRDAEKPAGLQGLMDMILEAAKASLQGAGSAAGLVPILAEVPGDDVNSAFAHIKFDTPLTAEIAGKLDQAIRRLALGLDAPPEVLLGQGSANHWSAWQISDDEIKTQVDPLALRVADALTEAYFRPALKALNKDPDKFTLWYDTAPLAVRPNRLDDAIKLYDKGALNQQALVEAGAFDDNDVAKEDERQKWMVWELVKLNPQLAADPEVQRILGLPAIQAPAAPGALPPAPGQEVAPVEEAPAEGTPEEPTSTESPAQQASDEGQFAVLLPAAEQVVLRALEVAGGRMLDRHTRGKFAAVPRYDLHTRVAARNRAHAEQLLEGAFAHVPTLAAHAGVPPNELEYLLRGYCTELLIRGFPHGAPLLREVLVKGGQRRGR